MAALESAYLVVAYNNIGQRPALYPELRPDLPNLRRVPAAVTGDHNDVFPPRKRAEDWMVEPKRGEIRATLHELDGAFPRRGEFS